MSSIEAVNIDGEDYLTIKQFSEITNRSDSCIRHLIIRGNQLRKLEVRRIGSKPFIPLKELFEFPFVQNGRPNELGFMVTNYKEENGNIITVDKFEYNPKYVKEGDNE